MSKSAIVLFLCVFSLSLHAQFNVDWEITTDGGYGNYDDAKFLRVSDEGVYVAGVTLTNSFEDDVFLIKYDHLGNVLWSKIEDIGGYDKPLGLEFDEAGNVYMAITGQSDTNSWGERDFVILKYQTDGEEVFRKQHNYFVNLNGQPYNVLGQAPTMNKNSYGRFVFCGISAGDSWLVEIDQPGEIYNAVLDTLPIHSELPYLSELSVVFDPMKNTHYIGCLRNNDTGPGYKSVFFLLKIDNSGEILWEKQMFEFPGKAMYSGIGGAEFRTDGGAYFNIQLRQSSGVNDDVFYYPHLLGVHNDGDVIFDVELPVLPGNDTETELTGMALDKGGNIWVTGDQDYKYFVSKYSAAGEKIWEAIDSTSQKGYNITCDGYTGIVSSADGLGNAFIKKYEFNGDELISHSFQGVSSINGYKSVDIETYEAGKYYFLGNKGAGARDVFLMKFNDPSVNGIENELPVEFDILRNYPNPFNPETIITFSLKKGSDIELTVYNSLGIKLREIYSGFKSAGEHKFEFNASGLASGVYVCELKIGNKIYSNKMLLLK